MLCFVNPWGPKEPQKGRWLIYLCRNYGSVGYMTPHFRVHLVPKDGCHFPSHEAILLEGLPHGPVRSSEAVDIFTCLLW